MIITATEMFEKPLRENNFSIKENHPFGKAGICFSRDADDFCMDYWMYCFEDIRPDGVGLNIMPAYYENYLKDKLPGGFNWLKEACAKVNEAIALIVANAEKHSKIITFRKDDTKQLFEVEYAADFSLAHLARIACTSVSKLKYSFKTIYGCNISEYHCQLRIKKAQELLQSGMYSVADVAALVGYKATAAFTKMFKEKTGMLPKDCRKSVIGS